MEINWIILLTIDEKTIDKTDSVDIGYKSRLFPTSTMFSIEEITVTRFE